MKSPSPDALERFAAGRSDAQEARLVARWLEVNPQAAENWRQAADRDTWIQSLRSAATLPLDSAREMDSVIQKIQERTRCGDSNDDSPYENTPTQLDQFRILGVLGRGGMGVVCEAVDERLGRNVAIKIMKSDLADVAEHRQRFLQEARAVAAIEHESIVPILSAGETQGLSYLVMPLLRGETLASRLQRGPLSIEAVMKLALDVATGLQAAHAASIIHRDIKPSNIWLERNADGAIRRARLLDFGLARSLESEHSLTRTNHLIGTLGYLAPEQARGESGDVRSDIFALGCTLYEASTGKRAFAGKNILEVLAKLASATPVPIAQVRPEFPRAFSSLIQDLLAKEPDQRPPTMLEVIERIQRLGKQYLKPPEVPTSVLSSRTSEWFGGWTGRQILFALGAMGSFAGLGLLGILITIRHPDGTETKIQADGNVKVTVNVQGNVEVARLEPSAVEREPIAEVTAVEKQEERLKAGATLSTNWNERTSLTKLLEIGAAIRVRLPTGAEHDAKRVEDFVEGSSIINIYAERNPDFTDDFFESYVVPLRNLQRLDVPQAPKLVDAQRFFQGVSKLKSLTQLISTLPLDDEGCLQLSQCTDLAYLFWVAPRFTPAGTQQLLKLKRLREFQFVNGDVQDEALAPLLELPLLEAVVVTGCKLHGQFLDGPTTLPNISRINLSFCQFEKPPLRSMERFPNLNSIHWERLLDSGIGLTHLSNLQHLKQINLQESTVSSLDGIRALAQAPALEAICFHAALEIRDPQVQALGDAKPSKLQYLDLSKTNVTDAGVDAIVSLPQLQKLILWNVKVSDEGFAKLASSTTLVDLQMGSATLSRKTIRALAARDKPWENIWIVEGQLTDDAVDDLAELKVLTSLKLMNTQITDAGFDRLRVLLPNIQVLR